MFIRELHSRQMYRETRMKQMKQGETLAEVVILWGGFSHFQEKYRVSFRLVFFLSSVVTDGGGSDKHDPLLVEKWSSTYWD
jgi:hypothetical protein